MDCALDGWGKSLNAEAQRSKRRREILNPKIFKFLPDLSLSAALR
jgi:hypothetical protein